MTAGVINAHADSDDEDMSDNEQKEIRMELEQFRQAAQWVNQENWDTVGDGRATSPSLGVEVDLRLDLALTHI